MVKRAGDFDPLATDFTGHHPVPAAPIRMQAHRSWNASETDPCGASDGSSRPLCKTMKHASIATDVEASGADDELVCGLGSCYSPSWMQSLASKQMFLATFCLACVLQGMFYTYFVSVLTTIEKLFQIQSKTTGIIMSATEIGQIGGSLLLTYYGGQGHRPKWIGWGMILFAASSFLCSLPHFLFWRTKPNVNALASANLEALLPTAHLELNLVCRLLNKTSLVDDVASQSESQLYQPTYLDQQCDSKHALPSAFPRLHSTSTSPHSTTNISISISIYTRYTPSDMQYIIIQYYV